jgi:hypothetical protein
VPAAGLGLLVGGLVLTSTLADEPSGPPPTSSTTSSSPPSGLDGMSDRADESAEALPTGEVRYVAPHGSDGAAGTAVEPWGTLQHALTSVQAGETLIVRGGTYHEDVHVTAEQIHPGTASEPVVVRAAPGERPVIRGLLWLTNPSHWQISGLDVTWNPANRSDEHMVRLSGGTGWRFSGAELSGARSYAALLVSGGATAFMVDHCFVHDTEPANDTNQDHLIYVDNGPDGNGVIEHNVLARSANGRGVKLGPGSLSEPGTSHIVIRHNTFYDNRGPANIQLSGSSSDNEIYGNLLDGAAHGSENITGYRLTGSGNVVRDNLGWGSVDVADFGVPGLVDGGGNVHLDPMLVDPAGNDFRAGSSRAASYGTAETARALLAALDGR